MSISSIGSVDLGSAIKSIDSSVSEAVESKDSTGFESILYIK